MMKHRKKNVRLMLCVILILCVLGIVGCERELANDVMTENEDVTKKAYEGYFSYFTHRNNAIKEYQLCYDEASNLYGFFYKPEKTEEWSSDKPIIISKEYFINVDYRGTSKHYEIEDSKLEMGHMQVDEAIDYFTLELINLKTGTIEKKLDMKVLLAEYLENNIYIGYTDQGIETNGQHYIHLYLCEKPEQEDVWQEGQEVIDLLFNIETETFKRIAEHPQIDDLRESYYWRINKEFLGLNDLNDDFYHLKIEELYNQGELKVRVANNIIFQKNLKLYELFPELKTYAKESQCEYALLHMPVNEETTALDVLEYFVDPEVGLRFDGFTLTGEESIDGQEHYIESREQFEQYYNGYWESREEINQ